MTEINIDGTEWEQGHPQFAPLAVALLGRSIVDVESHLPEGDPGWSDHGSITLVLDDGARLDCGGWGHDAWGPQIDYTSGEESR